MRKYVVIAVGVSIAAIALISFLTMDRNTFKAVSRIEALSLVVVLTLVLSRWLSECWRYDLIIRAVGRRLPFRNTSKAVLGSAFTGSVTPYRSAAFPVQVFFLSRYGLTVGEATAVSATAGAVSLLVATVAMPVVLVLSASKINVGLGLRTVLIAVAVLGFFAFMLALYSMRDPSRVSRTLERVAPRFLRGRPEFRRFEERLAKGMGDFSRSLRAIVRARKGLLVLIVLLTVLFWFSGAFVTSWILRGLGFPQFFWKALLAQMLVSSILPFTPVPAESGVAEVAFAGVFGIFIQKNAVAFVTLAWRFFMLYLPLAILGVAFMLAANDARRTGAEREAGRQAAPEPPAAEPAVEEA